MRSRRKRRPSGAEACVIPAPNGTAKAVPFLLEALGHLLVDPEHHFFGISPTKIFLFFDLQLLDMAESVQNIEPQQLVGKILSNKELASHFTRLGPMTGMNSIEMPAHIIHNCALGVFLSKGCSSQEMDFRCGKEQLPINPDVVRKAVVGLRLGRIRGLPCLYCGSWRRGD